MQIDTRIFNEIIYVSSNLEYSSNSGHPNNYDIVERCVRIDNPPEKDEANDAYAERIDDEMASYPMIGIIPKQSMIAASLYDWQAAGHKLPLLTLDDHHFTSYSGHYFLTKDSNYNPLNDLFQDYSGKTQQEFLNFINAEN